MPFATKLNRQAVAEAHQEDFERWQQDRWWRDEITDQSERLASPMVNTFDYRLTAEGLVTDLDEPMRPVFVTGLHTAEQMASVDSRWQFELNRRRIELDEFNQLEDYAFQIGEGMRITSLSLDGSDYEGMRAVAEALGHRLPMDRPSSEDILQTRMWLPEGLVVMSPIPDAVRVDGVDIGGYNKHRQKMIVRIATASGTPSVEHQALIDRIRTAYDTVLTQRTGQKHYAGRVKISNDDARTFVEKQGDLLDAHMQVVNSIFAVTRDPHQRNAQMAPHRYNLAAALDDRLNGKQVRSLSDSGDNARAEGKEFDGDCPPAETAVTASDQAGRLGYSVEKWSQGVCRNCERTTQVWKVEDGGCSICPGCAKAHTWYGNAGLAKEREKALAERSRETQRLERIKKVAKDTVRRVAKILPTKKQDDSEYVERLGVGGMVRQEVIEP
jgi:hypothetical protein